jgi:hypothetical protein
LTLEAKEDEMAKSVASHRKNGAAVPARVRATLDERSSLHRNTAWASGWSAVATGAVPIQHMFGIKAVQRMAEVHRCQQFPGLVEAATDVSQRRNNSGALGLGEASRFIGHGYEQCGFGLGIRRDEPGRQLLAANCAGLPYITNSLVEWLGLGTPRN